MDDVVQQVRAGLAPGMIRTERPASGRAAGPVRRAARQRADVMGGAPGRGAGITQALRRLEREHIALLLAICELEGQDAADGADATHPARRAMNEALLVLLRGDLARTQHALALAADGRYGACEDCARPLSRRELELMPATTRCPACEAQGRRAGH